MLTKYLKRKEKNWIQNYFIFYSSIVKKPFVHIKYLNFEITFIYSENIKKSQPYFF